MQMGIFGNAKQQGLIAYCRLISCLSDPWLYVYLDETKDPVFDHRRPHYIAKSLTISLFSSTTNPCNS